MVYIGRLISPDPCGAIPCDETDAMKLIVGLGNPGKEYAQTRHNAGFMAIDRFVQRHNIPGPARARFHAGVLEGMVNSQKVLCIQPTTFMNRSGLSVIEAMGFYKIETPDLLVLVDDIALPLGRIRMRAEGSAGGHNGLKDIQRALGTQRYARLRIGIDAPNRMRQTDYVLGRFSAGEMDELDPALNATCDAIETWMSDGVEMAMTRHNAS